MCPDNEVVHAGPILAQDIRCSEHTSAADEIRSTKLGVGVVAKTDGSRMVSIEVRFALASVIGDVVVLFVFPICILPFWDC